MGGQYKDIEKRRATHRKWGPKRYAERSVMLEKIKLQVGCKKCGYKEAPEALQFHHRDMSTKLYTVSQMIHRSLESMNKEIEKCDVLCANCHAIETKAQLKDSHIGRPRK